MSDTITLTITAGAMQGEKFVFDKHDTLLVGLCWLLGPSVQKSASLIVLPVSFPSSFSHWVGEEGFVRIQRKACSSDRLRVC
jgi:hypothetical protein